MGNPFRRDGAALARGWCGFRGWTSAGPAATTSGCAVSRVTQPHSARLSRLTVLRLLAIALAMPRRRALSATKSAADWGKLPVVPAHRKDPGAGLRPACVFAGDARRGR